MFSDPRPGRRTQPASAETGWVLAAGALTALIGVVVLWTVGAWLDPTTDTDTGPVDLLAAQATGQVPVGGVQLAVFCTGLLLLLGLGAAFVVVALRTTKRRSRVDHLAPKMAKAREFEALTEPAMTADAERLRATGAGPGVPLAKLVNNGKRLFASWEWVQIWLMGPRAGKTTSVCVPQVLETKGPVVATSNKRDLVDLTRGPRSRTGVVWVHDVQSIIGEEPTWWWNPLSFVTSMERAEMLADIFVSSATSAGATQDAYFESDGRRLLSMMFYAAAIAGRPITDVFAWAQAPEDKTPRDLLLEHGQDAVAASLAKIQQLTPKQRDGVYGTMRPWVNVLSYDRVVPWVRDTGVLGRAEFDPKRFATSTDTLYLISKEGAGSTRAIAGALAVAVLTEAEEIAARQPGGRLSPPMTGVLDEVANVVRWRQLPDVYSHYGSRGIVLSSFFQGWDQGLEAFGEKGMKKLWSAANIRVAGSGLSDSAFLPFLSQLIGDHDVTRRTTSTQKGGRSVSTAIQRERLLDVNDLAALPRGRAVLSTSGLPPALVKLQHYSTQSYGNDVEASKDYYEQHAARNAAKA
ncbi:conjugal transfer protein TraG (plasmid) [Citricoccus sp. SGAir0253]|uniref:type IV secretory system conjugative DNA transfer family protein n=1 Tax=Citricoccus sp. SGAir0253 TaxID=2567881 RepID=UPI0010CD57EA|nr:TraM recognition domain-containing protein [Citricoccus sp. SGAir0253]QCU79608.1 conjugal transfer protein TraG [Citricoccus sp. SGAir0253]